MTNTKALADRISKGAKPDCCASCDRLLEAARILREVVPGMEEALKNIAQDMGAGRYAKAMAQAALNAIKEKD